ncbi:MAG: SAM-dependent methyltransferase [Kaistia sp. SCN 65-12]|nr:MAG: SAM-dependent methyltransferase [Kaistia sp. SCN 65-12]
MTTGKVVAKLWSLCHVLRDDGITYSEYATELTYLLFLKMLAETGQEEKLPKGYGWAELAHHTGNDQLNYYRQLMLVLSSPGRVIDPTVQAIFFNAKTKLRKPTNLKSLTSNIDQLDWFSAREEGLGNLYEGLLEKNATEKKSGAGQYFTPRSLIDCMVRLTKPQAGEVIQDPAAGTGGFIVAADRYVKDATDDLFRLSASKRGFQRRRAYTGMELVPDTHRLLLMNLVLHGVECMINCGDALSPAGMALRKADLVLTNPPFGSKGSSRPLRNDFSITSHSTNKQLAFVEHIVRALKPGGRAAVVVPDNVLFEANKGRRLRTWLMDLCDLHTVLRLPTGIFYAPDIKTNVLFLTRGRGDTGNTEALWVYDLRTNMPAFGKMRTLKDEDLAEFERAFGGDPYGKSRRKDEGTEGRFRCFSRNQIANRKDNLDIAWLRDIEDETGPTEPEDIAAVLIGHLKAALGAIEDLSHALETGEEVATASTKEAAE